MEQLNYKIAQLNDECRQSGGRIGRLMLTEGFKVTFPIVDIAEINELVATYNDFNEENDPHSEHDMGFFDYQNYKIIWRIDYYDIDLNYRSEDPSNSQITTRVLTIMLASNY
ncbi:MAG: DUF3768 domain-containing protein [Rhizobiales bacterium]|nr:DUF3768 domain-containing protein [Hyphomicrobiales bacterium]